MAKLNYDLIPEEVKHEALEALFNCEFTYEENVCTVSKKYVDEVIFPITLAIADSQQTKKPVDMEPLLNSEIVKELMGLVEAAYKEGYFDGAGDYPYCEWDVSDSKNQLDELKAGE